MAFLASVSHYMVSTSHWFSDFLDLVFSRVSPLFLLLCLGAGKYGPQGGLHEILPHEAAMRDSDLVLRYLNRSQMFREF